MLDIVVTHYEEPWNVGKKFFDMLAAQQAVNFDDIHVILIHDGTPMFPQCLFEEYPYKVEQFTPEHGGVSAARNFGIEQCRERWVQFCDFDDMYSNAFALHSLLAVLDTNDFDMLWGEFWAVDRDVNGKERIILRGDNVVFVHGKLFRRQYLMESGMRFDPELEFNEDCLFCTLIRESLPKERVGQLTVSFPFYIWCYTEKSTTSTRENWWKAFVGGFRRNVKVCDFFRDRPERYEAMVARTIWDGFFMVNLVSMPDSLKPTYDEFKAFYMEHREMFWRTAPETMQEVMAVSKRQYETGEDEALKRWGDNPMLRRQGVNIKKFLEGIETGVY